jgi:hypothetical protein
MFSSLLAGKRILSIMLLEIKLKSMERKINSLSKNAKRIRDQQFLVQQEMQEVKFQHSKKMRSLL